MSLMEKRQRVENVIDNESGKEKINFGIKIVAAAMLIGIVAGFFVGPLKSMALESIYVLVVGFILTGLIIILNNLLKKMDSKAITIGKGLFKTSMVFNIAAIGVCGIFAVLYIVLW